MKINRDIAPIFLPLDAHARYKGIHGGRGGAKSHEFAARVVERCAEKKTDVVCLREIQKSIKHSVKKLIESKIVSLGLQDFFIVQDTQIKSIYGGLIIFVGLQDHTAESIKGLEGFDIFWTDEASALGHESLMKLRPTVRKPGAEMWFSWNPDQEDDAIDILLRSDAKPESSIVIEVNYHDNPWFPPELESEMEEDKARDYQKYLHVWCGGYNKNLEGALFRETDLLYDGQPVPEPFAIDGVFAVIDSALKSGHEHDSTGVVYFAVSRFTGHPLTIIDYDKVKIDAAYLIDWLPSVDDRLEELAKLTAARNGNVGIYIEDKASGIVLLQQAKRNNIKVTDIDSKLTAIGKDGRAIKISPHVHSGRVKISKYAYNKVTTANGRSKNYLLSEITTHKIGVPTKDHDDLLDCFCYGVAIGLGDYKKQ